MAWLSQIERFLQITTPLAQGELILIEFQGEEGISNLFHFNLVMISENTNIKPEQLLGKPVSIKLNINANDSARFFHGIVIHFCAGIIKNGIRYYYADVKPWLSLLNYTSDCLIFQNLNVISIARKIFSDFAFHDYDISQLKRSYPNYDCSVQYNETSLNFLSRLFEREGIFYFFQHQEKKHILVLADKTKACQFCMPEKIRFASDSQRMHCITQWNHDYSFYSGQFSQKDYNFETPDTSLETQKNSLTKLAASQKFSHYVYPGNYENFSEGNRLTQQHFASHEADYDIISGEGNCTAFTSAGKFSLQHAPIPSDDGDYILTSIIHHASDGSYIQGSESSQSYSNYFYCISHQTNSLPLPVSIKPKIYGVQTALVVAPSEEEIFSNQYASVKVQFHWDRKGKKNESSSCWIRVAQSLAGNNWGTLFLPRIGQEVIVHFLEGNPDRPVILGCLYNANNLPPFSLPSEQTRSGIKTRSTKNGGVDDSNELRFEDRIGNEELYIHAQKDLKQKIKNDLGIEIGNQATIEAKKSIRLSVNQNAIEINTKGIFINGEKVNINE
jgi:type VI secretion system secreted protein VgrG